MSNATIVKNLIPVRHSYSAEMGNRLEIDAPEGWDSVKKICRKVLEFENLKYTFVGWNSDRNVCYFKEEKNFARII